MYFDLGILKVYLHTKNEVSMQCIQKIVYKWDRWMDRHRHSDRCPGLQDLTISGDCFRRLLKMYLFARY